MKLVNDPGFSAGLSHESQYLVLREFSKDPASPYTVGRMLFLSKNLASMEQQPGFAQLAPEVQNAARMVMASARPETFEDISELVQNGNFQELSWGRQQSLLSALYNNPSFTGPGNMRALFNSHSYGRMDDLLKNRVVEVACEAANRKDGLENLVLMLDSPEFANVSREEQLERLDGINAK